MRRTYKEVVQFCVPEGFTKVLAQVADREHLTVSGYVRRLAMMDIERRDDIRAPKPERDDRSAQAA